MERFERTRHLIGHERLDSLRRSTVFVFGVGGVGSFAAEALGRAGIGTIGLVDYDTIHLSNLNRQIHALEETVGEIKVRAMARRLKAINPGIDVRVHPVLADAGNIPGLLDPAPDYVIDAVDMVTAKLALIEHCVERGIPVVSCMGTGNKVHPEKLEITDLSKTKACPLAKVMRRELKKRDIRHLKVVYSRETPLMKSREVVGSLSTVPSVAGLLLASAVINEIIGL